MESKFGLLAGSVGVFLLVTLIGVNIMLPNGDLIETKFELKEEQGQTNIFLRQRFNGSYTAIPLRMGVGTNCSKSAAGSYYLPETVDQVICNDQNVSTLWAVRVLGKHSLEVVTTALSPAPDSATGKLTVGELTSVYTFVGEPRSVIVPMN